MSVCLSVLLSVGRVRRWCFTCQQAQPIKCSRWGVRDPAGLLWPNLRPVVCYMGPVTWQLDACPTGQKTLNFPWWPWHFLFLFYSSASVFLKLVERALCKSMHNDLFLIVIPHISNLLLVLHLLNMISVNKDSDLKYCYVSIGNHFIRQNTDL